MKAMKKALALGLALAMVVTAVPVTSAQAASTAKLSASTVSVAAGTAKKQTKSVKVTTPSTWKSVKVTASSSDKKIATVKVSGKTVKVTAVKKGSAKVTVKVSAKKSGKTVKKTLTAKVKVINAGLRFADPATEVVVGESVTLTAKKSPKAAVVTFKSSDDKIATVDADGKVTAVKAGKVTITATSDYGKEVTTDVTVKNVLLQSVKQAKFDTLDTVIFGTTKDIKATDIKIINKETNVAYAVKAVTPDATDATKVKVETYVAMTDGKNYTVELDGVTKEFTATDGTVANVNVTPLTIPANTTGKVITAQLLDKDGVVVDEAAYGKALNKTDFTITTNNGYFSENNLVLPVVGNTATAKVTYHTYDFNADGTEKNKIEKEFTITAVQEEAATLSNFKYTITKKNETVNWDKITTTTNKFSVSDKTVYVHFNFVDSSKTNVTKDYSVVSADQSILLLNTTSLTTNPVAVVGVKAGSTYINVVNKDNKVVTSLPIVVTADRKLTSVNVTKTALTVSNETGVINKVETAVKGIDQYSDEATVSVKEAKILSGDDSGKAANAIKASVIDKKLVVEVANSVKAGTYQIQVVFKSSNIDGEVSVLVTLTVVDTSKVADSNASFQLELPTEAIDLAIAPGTKASDLKDKAINISIAEYKLGAKVATVSGASITIKDPKGAVVDNGTKLYIVSDKIVTKKLSEMGTYTVEATASVSDANGKSVIKKFSGSFTVKDTQMAASATIKETKNIETSGEDAATVAKNVLEMPSVAEFTYDRAKVETVAISGATAKLNGKALYIEKAYITITEANATYKVPVTINASFTLK